MNPFRPSLRNYQPQKPMDSFTPLTPMDDLMDFDTIPFNSDLNEGKLIVSNIIQ